MIELDRAVIKSGYMLEHLASPNHQENGRLENLTLRSKLLVKDT